MSKIFVTLLIACFIAAGVSVPAHAGPCAHGKAASMEAMPCHGAHDDHGDAHSDVNTDMQKQDAQLCDGLCLCLHTAAGSFVPPVAPAYDAPALSKAGFGPVQTRFFTGRNTRPENPPPRTT